MSTRPSIKNAGLVLRFTRLEYQPPGFYETQILRDRGFPMVIVEFGNRVSEDKNIQDRTLVRISPADPWLKWIPRPLRSTTVFVVTALRLVSYVFRDGKPVFVVAHDNMEHVLALMLKIFFKIPYAVHVHEVVQGASPFIRFLMLFEQSALNSAEFLIFPEKERARVYQERFNLTVPIEIVYNCPRLRTRGETRARDLRTEFKLPADFKIMLYVGGLGELNHILEAVEAVTRIPRLAFIIAGWGGEEYIARLRSRITELGISDRVFLTGYVKDKWEYLAGADFGYCLYGNQELRTQHSTTASNKLSESLAVGNPVILGPQQGSRDFLQRFPVGVVAEGFTPEAIAESIQKLISDGVAFQRMKQQAISAHETSLNYEAQLQPAIPRFEKMAGIQALTAQERKKSSGY